MSSPFKVLDSIVKVALLPVHTEYPLEAVKEQINEMLFRYHEDLAGIPLVYSDLHLPPSKEYGRIMNELPWIHIDVMAKILLFQPENGQILTGQINKVSCDSRDFLSISLYLKMILSILYIYNRFLIVILHY